GGRSATGRTGRRSRGRSTAGTGDWRTGGRDFAGGGNGGGSESRRSGNGSGSGRTGELAGFVRQRRGWETPPCKTRLLDRRDLLARLLPLATWSSHHGGAGAAIRGVRDECAAFGAAR